VLVSLACARCFGELLWDAAFVINFGEYLFEERLNSFAEQIWGSFGEQEQLCSAALKNRNFGNSFKMQLWGAAFGSNFVEQFSGAALENSFEAPLCGTGLKHSRFNVIILQRYFREPFWETSLAIRFGE
jgi:hypothetical protein